MVKELLYFSQAMPALIILMYFFAAFSYVIGKRPERLIQIIAVVLLCAYPLSAIIETYGQYSLWLNDAVSKNFLPPVTPINYFLHYSFTHFWLGRLIGITAAILFYLFLRLLAKRRPWLFTDGEIELGFVCVLIAGWPGFVLFLPLIFITALPWTIFRQLALKQERTTLGAAFLLAAGVVLLAGGWLIGRLGLGVLRI